MAGLVSTSPAAFTTLAMSMATTTTSQLFWVPRGIDSLDRVGILWVKGMLNNCVREKICSISKDVMAMGVSPDHLDHHLELVMRDAGKEEADFLPIIVWVTRVS